MNLRQAALRRFRPILLTVTGIIAFLVWQWLDSSTMDYRHDVAGGGLRTAGWFIFGMPFLLGFAALSTMPFSMLARKGKPLVAWAAMIIFFALAICFSYTRSTPSARLQRAFDVDVPSDTVINYLRDLDSFNNGTTTVGVIRTTPNFVDLVVQEHSLTEQRATNKLVRWMSDMPIPENSLCYDGQRHTVYYDVDASLLYFVRWFP